MSDTKEKQSSVVARFHELHESGCFVLPNPWDIGSALYLQHLGFQALATTSAGFAFTRGITDSVAAVSRSLMLSHLKEIVAATSLPVNADFQRGFADEPEGVATSVELCVGTGVAGLSIEDSTGDKEMPLYEFDLAVERIEAARAAIDGSGVPAVLTARCEALLVGHPDPQTVIIERLVAFAEAGADCLYAPGVRKPDEIETIVKAVAPKPVNVLVAKFNSELSLSQLSDLGVRRISVGSALAGVALGAFMRAARSIAETGKFESLKEAAPFSEVSHLLQDRG
ncbi:MAG TPA: isocitrate lyase/phosphoenolpyruvate mutase family protein [Pyrinomonadaceae bacterium]|jgi:2-methylisocitrate lyase-like PEP mutase family enzyme